MKIKLDCRTDDLATIEAWCSAFTSNT